MICSMICMICMICMIEICQAGQIHGIPDLYDVAHVAEWEPYGLHDLCIAYFSWLGSELRTQILLPQNGRF